MLLWSPVIGGSEANREDWKEETRVRRDAWLFCEKIKEVNHFNAMGEGEAYEW